MKQTEYFIPLIIFITITLLIAGYILINSKHINKPCGGFATNLPENQCPVGLKCVSENSYPDAGGNCQYLWSTSLTNQ